MIDKLCISLCLVLLVGCNGASSDIRKAIDGADPKGLSLGTRQTLTLAPTRLPQSPAGNIEITYDPPRISLTPMVVDSKGQRLHAITVHLFEGTSHMRSRLYSQVREDQQGKSDDENISPSEARALAKSLRMSDSKRKSPGAVAEMSTRESAGAVSVVDEWNAGSHTVWIGVGSARHELVGDEASKLAAAMELAATDSSRL